MLMNTDNHVGHGPALYFLLPCGGPAEPSSCCGSIQMLRCSMLLRINNAGLLISNCVSDVKGSELVMQIGLIPGNGTATYGLIHGSHIRVVLGGKGWGGIRSAYQIGVRVGRLQG